MQRGCACVSTVSLSLCYMLEARRQSILLATLMDQAIGLSSGFGSLVSLTVESSTALCQSIKSFQNKERAVRELRDEAQDIESVLKTLQDSMDNMTVEVEILTQPLTRCRNACRDFNTLINESTEHSTEERASFRDWLKLKHMGEDISGFKNMLVGYSTSLQSLLLLFLIICMFHLPLFDILLTSMIIVRQPRTQKMSLMNTKSLLGSPNMISKSICEI
jgi:hypothetical protein